jgi:ABC-2 type transport system permease protein
MNPSIRRIFSVTRKEVRHILRDPQTLVILLLMPAFMMFLYGYALTTDVKEIRVAVEAPQSSPEIASIVHEIDASTLIRVVAVERIVENPKEYFKTRRVKALVRFPPGFSSSIHGHGPAANVQVLVDGSDANLATILRNAAGPLIVNPTFKALGISQPEVVTIHRRVLYNPQQRSALFFVPGLMVIILTMVSALLTSITLTREKELGTMAQLLVSPLRPWEIVLGKILPYVLLAAIDGALILVIGRLAFSVSVAGSLWLLAGLSLLYIFVALALGILISCVAPRQFIAMFGALIITLFPSVILTGFVFPVASMPWWLQIISRVIPASYYLEIVRGIILKGIGFELLWKPTLVLVFIGGLLVLASVKKFKVTL